MKKIDENIIVVERKSLPESSAFPGIDFDYRKFVNVIKKDSIFKIRSHVETDPLFKQVIPYSILFYKDKVFIYQRCSESTENRLSGLLSIGFGGHISEIDFQQQDFILQALTRELNEEIRIDSNYSIILAGILNDDRNKVGEVHIGVVYTLHLESNKISIKEKSIENLRLVDFNYLTTNVAKFESWSELCIDHINRLYLIK
jgi:predicted NUDIX family phosphoesterase